MRIPATNYQLEYMVGDELQKRLDEEERFTAHDITRALRAAHPHLHLPHWQVRTVVHAHMADVVAAGHYEAVSVDFGWSTAMLYQPAVRIPFPILPLLPLN